MVDNKKNKNKKNINNSPLDKNQRIFSVILAAFLVFMFLFSFGASIFLLISHFKSDSSSSATVLSDFSSVAQHGPIMASSPASNEKLTFDESYFYIFKDSASATGTYPYSNVTLTSFGSVYLPTSGDLLADVSFAANSLPIYPSATVSSTYSNCLYFPFSAPNFVSSFPHGFYYILYSSSKSDLYVYSPDGLTPLGSIFFSRDAAGPATCNVVVSPSASLVAYNAAQATFLCLVFGFDSSDFVAYSSSEEGGSGGSGGGFTQEDLDNARQEGYSEGYQSGVNVGASNAYTSPLTLVIQPIEAFLNTPFFGVSNFTIGSLLAIVLFVSVAIIFLRIFAGG